MRFDNKQLTIISPLSLIQKSNPDDLIGGVFIIMIGIYKITSPTKKVYIGQSINIEKRFKQYISLNSCKQRRLHRSFVKYGVDAHIFEIICQCDIIDLNNLERFYQDLYSATGYNGLNCSLTNTETQRYEHSAETKQNFSKQRKGRVLPKEWADKVRINLDKTRGRKNTKEQIQKRLDTIRNKGGFKHSDASKLKMSISQTGIKKNRGNSSEYTKKLISKNNGKSKSKITLHLLTGIFFDNAKDAAFCFGLKYDNVKSKLNGAIKTNDTNLIYA